MKKRTISAVLFVYNEKDYISELIDSIVSQTSKVDKIIVCDDMSTDDTVDILRNKQQELLGKIEIEILNNDRKGKVYAYEKALNRVDTDFFFVCGGDDVLEENYVKSMFDFINANEVEFAYSNQVWVDERLEPLKYTQRKTFYTIDDLFYVNYVGGLIFGKSSIIKSYLPFPKGLDFEDWYVSLTLINKYGRCYINNEKNYLYRRHENASTFHTSRGDKKRLIERNIKFLKLMVDKGFYTTILNIRIMFYQSMVEPVNIVFFMKIFFSKYTTFKEKIKLIVAKTVGYYN